MTATTNNDGTAASANDAATANDAASANYATATYNAATANDTAAAYDGGNCRLALSTQVGTLSHEGLVLKLYMRGQVLAVLSLAEGTVET